MKVKVYIEGGGDAKSLKSRLRQGFRRFLERAGLQGNLPGIVACGGRNTAYDRFSLGHSDRDTVAFLVVDSEGPVTANGPWQHLKNRDNWVRPSGVEDDQCHLMVQEMESWFLADREALIRFYGANFRSRALPQRLQIEDIPKKDVYDGLKRATIATSKGRYSKGSHSFKILGTLDPAKVQAASPYAKRFVERLSALMRSRA